jgi:hypothetical protein
VVKRARRKGRFFSNGWGNSTGGPLATIMVQVDDGPDTGRMVLIELKANQLGRVITSFTETLELMREHASHKTAVMTEDGEIHGRDADGRPMCERPAKFLGPAFYTAKRIKCAMCIDVILNN